MKNFVNSIFLVMLFVAFNMRGTESPQLQNDEQQIEKGVRAVMWAYPLFQMMSRYEIMTDPVNCRNRLRGSAPEGKFHHALYLLNPLDRIISCPNNDNWYEPAYLDLDKTNYLLILPPIADRYYSFTFFDQWTHVFKIINSKTFNGKEQRFIIARDSYQPSEEEKPWTILSPTPIVWVLGRILAKEGEDVSAIRDIQENLTLIPFVIPDTTVIHPLAPHVAETPNAAVFYNRVGRYLSRCGHIPENKIDYYEWFKSIGCTEQGLTLAAQAPENFKILTQIHDKAIERATKAFFSDGEFVNGWVTSFNCGNVVDNDALCAGFAYKSLGALTVEECVYFRANKDCEKKQLTGKEQYVLHFDADNLPPVDAFWSISLYDQHNFFVPNEINRFSIGDRTTGCIYNQDGSLDIIIQHGKPADFPRLNWLPSPAENFYIILRLYHPRQIVYDRKYLPPLIRRIAADGAIN